MKTIESAKKDIMDQINTLQSKLDLLESIDNVKPEITGTPKQAKPKRKYNRRTESRHYLQSKYRGLSVAGAVRKAAINMPTRFRAKDMFKAIFDYKGVRRVSRIHGTVYPTLYADFNALGYGIFEMKAGGIND